MPNRSTRILGIDPGSVITGYGIIESDGVHSVHIAHGALRVTGDDFPSRLGKIFNQLQSVVSEYQPVECAVESVFMNKNAMSALKLGQARGAAIAAVVAAGIPVGEYSPRLIKQAVTGTGSAKKEQVQHMVGVLLNLRTDLQADAADGLAVALCHAHARRSNFATVSS
ncbi:MAG: crossover junction endodeoxyribonuclease RuvC [Pseudomonadota bacterium]